MSTTTISDLYAQVGQEKADAKYKVDLEKNLQVIKMRIQVGGRAGAAKFALYDGGDAHRMAEDLRTRGLSKVSVDFHGTVWGQL